MRKCVVRLRDGFLGTFFTESGAGRYFQSRLVYRIPLLIPSFPLVGSWTEYLEGWGQTVIVGRARLGGIPMGVIAVETRGVDRLVPADPSNPESSEVKETMGGKVWFPDSAMV